MGHYDNCREGYCGACGAAPGNMRADGTCPFCKPTKRKNKVSKNEQKTVVGHDTWRQTQDKLMACTTKEDVMKLIEIETAGANRARWLNRMRGRYKVLRNEEEERTGILPVAADLGA